MSSSVAVNASILLCKHHHLHFYNFFIFPNWISIPMTHELPIYHCQALGLPLFHLLSLWIQIKTTRRCPFTSTRMAIIKTTENDGWRGCEDTRTWSPVHCWYKHKMAQPLWKTIWQFLKKLNIDLVYDPSIPLLGIYMKELIMGIHKCPQQH